MNGTGDDYSLAPDDVSIVLEAKIVIEEDPFYFQYHLLSTINRYRYDLRIYPVKIGHPAFPYVGRCNNVVSCLPKTLLCTSVAHTLVKDKKWCYLFQLTYRPTLTYVWNYRRAVKKLDVYPSKKFQSWLPENLTWKVL